MRIALINRAFVNSMGGGERYAVDLAAELLRQGHEVLAVGNRLEDLPAGAAACRVPMPRKPGWLRNYCFCRAAARALAAHRADFDVSYALTPVFPVDACCFGGGMNRHWLHSRFASPWKERLYPIVSPNHGVQNWLEDQVCRSAENCRLLVANSEMVRRHIIEYGHAAPERVAVILNAIDLKRFNPAVRERHREETRRALGIAADDIVVGYSSMNWERKGLATVIRALGRLADRRFRLLVLGRGDEEKHRKLADDCGLPAACVIFHGFAPAPEKIYAGMDVNVLPTRYDSFGNVIAEALACGVPSITTEQAGAGELITPGKNGFVMASYDDDAALAGYLQPFTDAATRREMSARAAEGMLAHGMEQLARQTVETLSRLR